MDEEEVGEHASPLKTRGGFATHPLSGDEMKKNTPTPPLRIRGGIRDSINNHDVKSAEKHLKGTNSTRGQWSSTGNVAVQGVPRKKRRQPFPPALRKSRRRVFSKDWKKGGGAWRNTLVKTEKEEAFP